MFSQYKNQRVKTSGNKILHITACTTTACCLYTEQESPGGSFIFIVQTKAQPLNPLTDIISSILAYYSYTGLYGYQDICCPIYPYMKENIMQIIVFISFMGSLLCIVNPFSKFRLNIYIYIFHLFLFFFICSYLLLFKTPLEV